jgi:hypothetical protein
MKCKICDYENESYIQLEAHYYYQHNKTITQAMMSIEEIEKEE